MSRKYSLLVGIPTPESAEAVNEAATFQGMRKAIFKASFESSLIRHCIDKCLVGGASGEEMYVMLAYQALLRLEQVNAEYMSMIERTPMPPWIKTAEQSTS